ncbi:MAG: hypothetical protein GZ088_11240 [Acidipila sp.]|nr:hypothetical protein [Acidipila sp.]
MEGRIFLSPQSKSANVRTYLSQIGTKKDLERTKLILKDGLRIQFHCDDAADDGTPEDLLFEGTVHFDADKKSWYALLDPESFHHRSEALRGKG